jgi:5'-AMP-activated protein kinase catalytic alpha subunit
MIAGKKYHGLNSDIWSCGIILYAMTCGYLPFEDPNTSKLYKKILNCDYLIPGVISKAAKDLIRKVLNTDPQKRFLVNDIRTHEWYTQVKPVEMEGIIIGKDRVPVIEEFLSKI